MHSNLFRAIAAGYEAMALIGCVAGGMETVHRGFHPTSVFGPFGAATASLALHAYQNNEPVRRDLLIAAWGHALSQAGGAMQFSLESTGGEVKRVHAAPKSSASTAQADRPSWSTAPARRASR